MRLYKLIFISVALLTTTLLSGYRIMEQSNPEITQTGLALAINNTTVTYKTTTLPDLDTFVRSVTNGNADQVVGVYVPGTLALPAVQQPKNDPNFVSRDPDVVTQFDAVSKFDSVGLLAHNYLAGDYFYDLMKSQVVIIVYGNGARSYYKVSEVQQYQALSPTSPQSDFIDLSDPEQRKMSAGELFSRVYTLTNRVIFQTCILRNGDPSWGRMFVIATPMEEGTALQPATWRERIISLF
ncbi:MAG TPA: hypothetical protein VHO48_08575 [Anaerolineaceae bacterium]|nr:hypothetical protein [Anaerolineaceae bacterium]